MNAAKTRPLYVCVRRNSKARRQVKSGRWITIAIASVVMALGIAGMASADTIRESALRGHGAGHRATPASAAVPQSTATVTIRNVPAGVANGAAQLVGHLDPTQMLRLVIGIQPPHMEDEEALLEQLHTKESPQFHQFLTEGQWNAQFAPAAEDEKAVVDWAESQGLTVTHRFGHRLLVDVEGPAATIEKAFGVTLNLYQVAGSTRFSNDRDPQVPASLGTIIHAVIGLNNIHMAHSPTVDGTPAALYAAGAGETMLASMQADANGTPDDIGVTPNITKGNFDPGDLWSDEAYDTIALYNQGHCCNPLKNPGNSPPDSSIAIATAYAVNISDVNGFAKHYNLAENVQPFDIDGTPTCPPQQPNCNEETTLDIEWSLAMSNSRGSLHDTAKIWVYQGVDSSFGTFADIYGFMISDGHARVMSTSWGCAEIDCYDTGTMDTIHGLFNQMTGMGWTLLAASGDNGATAAIPGNNNNFVCDNVDRVQYPTSDPDVVGVGGTTLSWLNGKYLSETGWTGGTTAGSCNGNNGGSGGGCSSYYFRPGYQRNKHCPVIGGYMRSVPDIALNANSGQNIFYNGKLVGVGGTSIAAPEVAGFFAQENAYLETFGSICGVNTGKSPCAPLGNGNYPVYEEGNTENAPHDPFYDILTGCNSNDNTAARQLHYYCAEKGYDQVTGWGTFNMLQLAWAINYNVAADTGAPEVMITGPTKDKWYNKNETVNWTVTDTGGKFKPTGVAGFSQDWDKDPGDVGREAHPGTGNSFYGGPQFPNGKTGTLDLGKAGQGCHTANVRAWDNMGLGSGDVTYGVVCYDTIPPVSSHTQSPAPDSHGWNKSAVTITLKASDPGAPATGSGVAHTYYSIDDPFCISIALGVCTVYESPFAVKTEGQHSVYVLSDDVAGNFETRLTLPVNIDLTAPVTKDSLSGTKSGADYVSAVKVTLTATDNLSGVESTVYAINGGSTHTYSAPLTISALGETTITFHSTDKAGNIEATKTVSFTIEDQTTTTLASSDNPSVTGSSVTFTATVKSSVGAAAGSVAFKNGSAPLGTVTLTGGMAKFTTSSLAIGMHSITAAYAGTTNVLGSTSPALTQNVLAMSSTSLTESLSATSYGQAVTFTAMLTSPTAGTISGTVNFYNGVDLIGTGTVSGGKAAVTTAALAVGAHSIVATYLGSSMYDTSTSGTVTHTVNVAETATKLSASPNPSLFGQFVTYTATVTAVAPGGGTPTGAVTFLNGGTTLSTVTLSGGKATITNNTLPIGTSSITAKYDGSASYSLSTSSAVVQKVNPTSTSTNLSASPNPSTVGETVSFLAVVSSVAPGSGVPTGSVTFKDGTTTLSTVFLGAGGIAKFSTSTLAAGSHSITAEFPGTADHLPSTSAVVVQKVN